MNAIAADAHGRIRASFALPVHLAPGRHRLEFVTNQQHQADMTYLAREWIAPQERRSMGQAVATRLGDTPPDSIVPRTDALVQTFTLSESRHVAGIELWITHRGKYPLIIQLRETRKGQAGTMILAQAHIPVASMQEGRRRHATRITWPPVWLVAQHAYAIALSTRDPKTQVAVAYRGHVDSHAHRRVMSADLSGGTLYRGKQVLAGYGLSYRLLGARFTHLTHYVSLGKVTLHEASDLIALTTVDRVSAHTSCHLSLTDEAGRCHVLNENQPVAFAEPLSGTFRCQAHCQGSATQSPVLYRGFQWVSARLSESADYVTRTIPAASDSTVTITYEAQFDGRGNVAALVETAPNRFEAATLVSSRAVGEAWVERVHRLRPLNREQTRVKLILSGNAACRTRVRQLRVVVT